MNSVKSFQLLDIRITVVIFKLYDHIETLTAYSYEVINLNILNYNIHYLGRKNEILH